MGINDSCLFDKETSCRTNLTSHTETKSKKSTNFRIHNSGNKTHRYPVSKNFDESKMALNNNVSKVRKGLVDQTKGDLDKQHKSNTFRLVGNLINGHQKLY